MFLTRNIATACSLMALALMVPAHADETPAELTEPMRLAETDDEFSQCTVDLRNLGARFDVEAPITDDDDPECGIVRPVRVSQVVRGVALSPPGLMRCETALSLARWVDSFVVPASRSLPDRGLVTHIQQNSTYVCRRRNNLPTGKLSEHSFGNAVDVRGFTFAEGKPIPIEPREREGTAAESFQRAVRASSCLEFTTVLGPGTDSAHADHLHLDIKKRNGGFRLCQ